MTGSIIRHRVAVGSRQPNLRNYEAARASFSWEQAERQELAGLPGRRGINIAYEAVDRHAAGEGSARLALRWLGREDDIRDFSYGDLARQSARFANVLAELGIERGERVFTLLGRVPELYVAALGTLKHRAVFSPLFSAFGPEPIHARLSLGDARVLVTTPALYTRKVAALRPDLPELEHVLLVGDLEDGEMPATRPLHTLTQTASEEYAIGPTDPEEMALLHFTSGTTGKPKGAVHVHQAVLSHHVTGKLALDLQPGDVFWCTADPGWVTGTSYGIIAPLSNGVTMIVDELDFDAERWYRILQDQRVTIWYTAPTAVRMLMKAGPELPKRFDLSRLRLIASVGEPLNPEAVVWGNEVLGHAIHDNWWQTETGGIMIANYLDMDIRPGSMGRPLPGIDAGIVQRKEDGGVTEVMEPGVQGELALRPGWPSMFRAYTPATLEDARGMLQPALDDPDPVLIFEHGGLYNFEGELPEDPGTVDIRHAQIRRPGREVSLITYGGTLHKTMEAAETLSREGIEAEVVDLRVLRPLDGAMIVESVSRTRRAVIVDEGWRSGGISAEISARIMEGAFWELDAPVSRVCTEEVPLPYPKHLEDAALPQPERIVRAVRELLGMSATAAEAVRGTDG